MNKKDYNILNIGGLEMKIKTRLKNQEKIEFCYWFGWFWILFSIGYIFIYHGLIK